jgi:hypothetical protein
MAVDILFRSYLQLLEAESCIIHHGLALAPLWNTLLKNSRSEQKQKQEDTLAHCWGRITCMHTLQYAWERLRQREVENENNSRFFVMGMYNKTKSTLRQGLILEVE